MANTKILINVPQSVTSFDGATISQNNPKKVFFEELKKTIWVNGIGYGINENTGSLTIQKNGEDLDTFYSNQSGNTTINIEHVDISDYNGISFYEITYVDNVIKNESNPTTPSTIQDIEDEVGAYKWEGMKILLADEYIQELDSEKCVLHLYKNINGTWVKQDQESQQQHLNVYDINGELMLSNTYKYNSEHDCYTDGVSSIDTNKLFKFTGEVNGVYQCDENGLFSDAELKQTHLYRNEENGKYYYYDDNNMVQLATLDDIKDGSLTIQKNGEELTTFSANQAENATINIEKVDISDLSNVHEYTVKTVDYYVCSANGPSVDQVTIADIDRVVTETKRVGMTVLLADKWNNNLDTNRYLSRLYTYDGSTWVLSDASEYDIVYCYSINGNPPSMSLGSFFEYHPYYKVFRYNGIILNENEYCLFNGELNGLYKLNGETNNLESAELNTTHLYRNTDNGFYYYYQDGQLIKLADINDVNDKMMSFGTDVESNKVVISQSENEVAESEYAIGSDNIDVYSVLTVYRDSECTQVHGYVKIPYGRQNYRAYLIDTDDVIYTDETLTTQCGLCSGVVQELGDKYTSLCKDPATPIYWTKTQCQNIVWINNRNIATEEGVINLLSRTSTAPVINYNTSGNIVITNSNDKRIEDSNVTIGGETFSSAPSKDTVATELGVKNYVDSINTGLLIETTYSELKELRDNGELVPGAQYRITDYECTTIQEDTQSAGHTFDIIVTAYSESVLNENARAIQHDGDTYFDGCNLDAWELKYCLDNDSNRFAWASSNTIVTSFDATADLWPTITFKRDDSNINNFDRPEGYINYQYVWKSTEKISFAGEPEYLYGLTIDKNPNIIPGENTTVLLYKEDKSLYYPTMLLSIINGIIINIAPRGVIYWMKDEYNNECPYDFKNIQFKRWKITMVKAYGKYNGSYDWYDYSVLYPNNTHSLVGTYSASSTSMENFTIDSDDFVWCYTFDNKYDENHTDRSVAQIDGYWCQDNIIKEYTDWEGLRICLNNIVFWNIDESEYDCYSNHFDTMCYNMTFDYGCYQNTFGYGCDSNTFENDCSYNAFGNYCYHNTFGINCASNTFGNYCRYNTFGNYCTQNTFGNYCYHNTFGYNCWGNTFGNYCHYNQLGDYCECNIFGDKCGINASGSSNTATGNILGAYSYNNKFGIGCYGNKLQNNVSTPTKNTACHDNEFGNLCGDNTLEYGCSTNTFGNYCYHNTFGINCDSNTFENDCSYNAFGNYCYHNTFGINCDSNTFGNYCRYNTFGNDCCYIIFGNSTTTKSYYRFITVESGNRCIYLDTTQTTSAAQYLQNVHVVKGVNNTGSYITVTIDAVGQAYETRVERNRDTGSIRIYNIEADKQDKLVSGENIKTLNGQSILGEGNLTLEEVDELTKSMIDMLFGDSSISEITNGTTTINGTNKNTIINSGGIIQYNTLK